MLLLSISPPMPTTRRPLGHSTVALWPAAESMAENALAYSRPGTDAVGTQTAVTTRCHCSLTPPDGSTASTVNPSGPGTAALIRTRVEPPTTAPPPTAAVPLG